jgi:hypothetical protein
MKESQTMNVLTLYRSLDAEQKRILREKQVDLNRPVDEVLTLLKPLATCDAVADKSRTPLGCTFALAILAAVILSVVMPWPALAIPLVLVAAVVCGTGFLFFWTRRVDLSNNLRQFVIPVLTLFREDIDSKRPFHVKLDLRPPLSKAKKTGESAPYKHGAYHKVIDSTYVDHWMTAEGVLVEGTRVWWSITDAIRERKKTKKNPRGKYKTKTKYAKKTKIEVEVGLQKKVYALQGNAGDRVKAGEKRNDVQIQRRQRSASLDAIEPRALIDIIAGVYQHARRVRKEA